MRTSELLAREQEIKDRKPRLERDALKGALAALLETINRHRWHVNSDEPDTIKAAKELLEKLKP